MKFQSEVKSSVSNDIKNNHAKIVERQKMTYAEAVKMQNREYMEEMKQPLKRSHEHDRCYSILRIKSTLLLYYPIHLINAKC